MRCESGYYPAGAEYDPAAPWNEKTIAPTDVEVEVTVVMKKRFVVTTDNYEMDEEGYITEYNDIEQDVQDQLEIPAGWDLVEIEDVDY